MSTNVRPTPTIIEAERAFRRFASAKTPPPAPPRRAVLSKRAVIARTVAVAVLTPLILTLPGLLSSLGAPYALDYGVIIAMVVLAITVLGWIGEISLAPVAQMGFGTVVLDQCQAWGIPFVLCMVLVVLSSIPISLLLGVFALRLRGVYFAIATLAFAYMAQKTFFQTILGVQGAFGGEGSQGITRPGYFQGSDHRFYYLLMASLLLMAGICWAVNRSWIGTSLTALRESEMALSTLGHAPAGYKLFAICLSGAIATTAGAYFGMLQGLVPSNYFQPLLAVLYFGFAVIGGLGSVGGALAAGVVFGALPKYFESVSEGRFSSYDLFGAGMIVFAVLLWAPGGLADIARRLWQRVEGTKPRADARVEALVEAEGATA
jgi:branched-chain amino acid transport system permease protein